MALREYNREQAVAYAHQWAMGRNPAYYDFQNLGGDCTNFASQCLLAGGGQMNYQPTFGWYYRSLNDRAPAWSAVRYLYNFLTREERSLGPFAQEAELLSVEPGDIVQLKFPGMSDFTHSPVVVSVGKRQRPSDILVAAHSNDSDNRPLTSYTVSAYRPLHILGVRT